MTSLGLISLGCDKNTVDSEKLLGAFKNAGYDIVNNAEDADVILINTCAFIEAAKKESIDAIIETARLKTKRLKKIIVTGCLATRYYEQLSSELHEADVIVKLSDYDNLFGLIGEEAPYKPERVLSTPFHYAYLKISEGCDNRCSYCAIPLIRGGYKSVSIPDLIYEAERLTGEYGIKELILVAQDVTRYGIDLYEKYALLELLDGLEKMPLKWIRLMYCYPELVTDELIKRVSASEKIASYLDIPLQHISDRILKLMNRRNSSTDTYNLLDRIKKIDENISVRSTFIAGFPGESEEDFEQLEAFIRYAKFDNAGFFGFSREEDTPAYNMKGRINKRIINARVSRLYAAQTEMLINKYRTYRGRVLEVMYEGIDYKNMCYYGRSYMSAPVIDSRVLIKGDSVPEPGQILKVRISGNNKLDLEGEIV